MNNITRPILKWAGGKTQLLNKLLPKIPNYKGKYIEPFFGGGALYFALQPEQAIIVDSNPELINLYQVLAKQVNQLLDRLDQYVNREEEFYSIRSLEWEKLDPIDAASRTIFLNKTCFNGLYRVNRKGQFNVSYGKYKNPKIKNEANLLAVSNLLKTAQIICGDYKDILAQFASEGDFVFLDPPYMPVSIYSDFKRYTKEQFREENHRELAYEIKRLHSIGCHLIMTNSNHPLIHELYKDFNIDIIQSKRNISSNGNKRIGEDVIIYL